MRRFITVISILVFANGIWHADLYGQAKNDSLKVLKNTIRFNITNPLLFGGKFNVAGYERVLGTNMSVSVNTGRFSIPKFKIVDPGTGPLQLQTEYADKGYNLAFDYRFYLKKENKYSAPRGVYIGPYYSFNFFERTNRWSMTTPDFAGDFNTTLQLRMNLVGIELGYQFIILRRLAIDLILVGPGSWFYNIRTRISTTLELDDESLVFEKINEILAAKLPGHEILLSPGQFEKTGSFRVSSLGYRYIIHLGFRF